MNCTRTAAQSRKSNLFRIAVFNHIFHFVQRQRQPNSPTPATGHHQCRRRHRHRHHQALLAPPRQDSMLHSPFSILHSPFGYINLLCSASVAALSVQSCSIKKAQMRFRFAPSSASLPHLFLPLFISPYPLNWLFSLPLFASFGCPLFSTFSFCHEGNISKRKAENCSSLKLHLTSKKECSKCEISFSYPCRPFTCLECRPKPEVMSDKCANATSVSTSSLCLSVCVSVYV